MNHPPSWGNLIGSALSIAMTGGSAVLVSLIDGASIPAWGWFVISSIGVLMWTSQSDDRQQGFETRRTRNARQK